MIIFGTTTLRSTKGQGTFNCPTCSTQRPYAHKSANRFFTLYFIPLIPLGSVGEYVECRSCGGTYGVEVLDYDPVAEREELALAFRRILVLVMLAYHRAESAHVSAMRELLEEMFGRQIPEHEVYDDMRMAEQAGVDLVAYVQRETADFSPKGKLLVLKAAAHVVSAGGMLREDDKQRLRELGRALGVLGPEVEEIVSNDQGLLGR